jgi:hypothetical protein
MPGTVSAVPVEGGYMDNISRTAAGGLLVYVIGTAVCFAAAGAPGGDYHDGDVMAFISPHQWTNFTLDYLGALAALGLLVFGTVLRRTAGALGDLIWGLSIIGTTLSVTGAFLTGGFRVAMVEGGSPVFGRLPHAVAYTFGEIGNLLAVCGPAMFAGIIGIVLAVRTPMPIWLRIVTVIGGLCGILGPLYFTMAVFIIWAVVFAVWMLVRRSPAPTTARTAQQAAV